MRYILASHSPRRIELMKEISPNFISVDSNANEDVDLSLSPLEACIVISKRKADAVKNKYPNDVIISSDTIVTIDNLIIGKPKDKIDASNILNLLSNRTHQVITAYTIIYKGKVIQNHVITDVTFNKISQDLINKYIQSNSPLDKAGAYGIQDNDKYPIIKGYNGSLHNVIGFPIEEIIVDLKKNNLL